MVGLFKMVFQSPIVHFHPYHWNPDQLSQVTMAKEFAGLGKRKPPILRIHSLSVQSTRKSTGQGIRDHLHDHPPSNTQPIVKLKRDPTRNQASGVGPSPLVRQKPIPCFALVASGTMALGLQPWPSQMLRFVSNMGFGPPPKKKEERLYAKFCKCIGKGFVVLVSIMRLGQSLNGPS